MRLNSKLFLKTVFIIGILAKILNCQQKNQLVFNAKNITKEISIKYYNTVQFEKFENFETICFYNFSETCDMNIFSIANFKIEWMYSGKEAWFCSNFNSNFILRFNNITALTESCYFYISRNRDFNYYFLLNNNSTILIMNKQTFQFPVFIFNQLAGQQSISNFQLQIKKMNFQDYDNTLMPEVEEISKLNGKKLVLSKLKMNKIYFLRNYSNDENNQPLSFYSFQKEILPIYFELSAKNNKQKRYIKAGKTYESLHFQNINEIYELASFSEISSQKFVIEYQLMFGSVVWNFQGQYSQKKNVFLIHHQKREPFSFSLDSQNEVSFVKFTVWLAELYVFKQLGLFYLKEDALILSEKLEYYVTNDDSIQTIIEINQVSGNPTFEIQFSEEFKKCQKIVKETTIMSYKKYILPERCNKGGFFINVSGQISDEWKIMVSQPTSENEMIRLNQNQSFLMPVEDKDILKFRIGISSIFSRVAITIVPMQGQTSQFQSNGAKLSIPVSTVEEFYMTTFFEEDHSKVLIFQKSTVPGLFKFEFKGFQAIETNVGERNKQIIIQTSKEIKLGVLEQGYLQNNEAFSFKIDSNNNQVGSIQIHFQSECIPQESLSPCMISKSNIILNKLNKSNYELVEVKAEKQENNFIIWTVSDFKTITIVNFSQVTFFYKLRIFHSSILQTIAMEQEISFLSQHQSVSYKIERDPNKYIAEIITCVGSSDNQQYNLRQKFMKDNNENLNTQSQYSSLTINDTKGSDSIYLLNIFYFESKYQQRQFYLPNEKDLFGIKHSSKDLNIQIRLLVFNSSIIQDYQRNQISYFATLSDSMDQKYLNCSTFFKDEQFVQEDSFEHPQESPPKMIGYFDKIKLSSLSKSSKYYLQVRAKVQIFDENHLGNFFTIFYPLVEIYPINKKINTVQNLQIFRADSSENQVKTKEKEINRQSNECDKLCQDFKYFQIFYLVHVIFCLLVLFLIWVYKKILNSL